MSWCRLVPFRAATSMGDRAMTPHPTLWIALADGEHARLVARAADNALHTAVRIDSAAAHRQTSDLVSDRAGRSHESAAPMRHPVTPRSDPHTRAQHGFAREVAAAVNAAARENRFAALVLVAPPDVLHELEAALDADARARVVGTLMKDLAKVPDHALQPHLAEWVHPIHPAPR